MGRKRFCLWVARGSATFLFFGRWGERGIAMSNYYTIRKETLTGIADAIRRKNGTSDAYNAAMMAESIGQIKTGGGTTLNIAYGQTTPEDTTKLWIKTAEPAKVHMKSKLIAANEELEMGIGVLPIASYGMATAAVGTKVYLFGGYGDDRLSTINVFDTNTCAITTLNVTLPTAARDIAAAAVGTKVYLFGGSYSNSSGGNLSTINVFDTETNTISTLSETIPAANGIAAAVVGTKIYLFGGGNGSTKYNTIKVFDTETNTVSTLSATLPTGAYSIATAAVGTVVYLFGGYDSSRVSTIHTFDTQTNVISTLSATLPIAASGIAAAAVGSKVYLFGGASSANNMLSTINVFDTETNMISSLSATLPTAVTKIGVAVVGAKVYLFGGSVSSISGIATIHALTTSFPVDANTLLIEISLTENLVNLIASDTTTAEVGIANVYLGNADGCAERVAAAVYKDSAWVEIWPQT